MGQLRARSRGKAVPLCECEARTFLVRVSSSPGDRCPPRPRRERELSTEVVLQSSLGAASGPSLRQSPRPSGREAVVAPGGGHGGRSGSAVHGAGGGRGPHRIQQGPVPRLGLVPGARAAPPPTQRHSPPPPQIRLLLKRPNRESRFMPRSKLPKGRPWGRWGRWQAPRQAPREGGGGDRGRGGGAGGVHAGRFRRAAAALQSPRARGPGGTGPELWAHISVLGCQPRALHSLLCCPCAGPPGAERSPTLPMGRNIRRTFDTLLR